jgi:HEPN domain-containing protein
MDKEQIKALSKQARNFSEQAIELIEQGKYVEGHNLMRQAVEAGRKYRQLINQPKIDQGLAQLEKIHQA